MLIYRYIFFYVLSIRARIILLQIFNQALTFPKVQIEKYGKTPNFSKRQQFYSYFQNPSENS